MPVAGAIVGAALSIGSAVAAASSMTYLAIGLAVAGKAITAIARNAALSERQKGLKKTVRGTQSSLPVVYGQTRLAGKLVDARVDPNSKERRALGYVLAISVGSRDGSGVEEIGDIYIDDQLYDVHNGGDPTLDHNKPYSLSSTEVGMDDQTTYANHINVKTYSGTSTQTVDADLNAKFPNAWPSTSELRYIAYTRMFLIYNEEVYGRSIPNFEFEVKGNKVYDPRTDQWLWDKADSTGTPTQHPGENPALCIRDFMLSDAYGLGLTTDDLVEQSFIDEANHCDDLVSANTNFADQPRFSCNGALDTGRDLRRNLDELLSSCRGQIIFQGGKYRLHIPKIKTAVSYHIDEEDIIGDYQWTRAGYDDTANSVTSSYVDTENGYSADDVTWPKPGQTNDALAEDGGKRNNKEIQLPFVTRERAATRIAMTTMKESREDASASFAVNEEGLQLEIGDVVKHSHDNPGWDKKLFWVSTMSLDMSGRVVLGLSEYSDEAYDLDTFDTSTAPPGTELPDPTKIGQPSNVSVTSGSGTAIDAGDGSRIPRALVTWTPPSNHPFFSHIDVRYRPVTTADGSSTSGKWQLITTLKDSASDDQIYLNSVQAGWEYEVEVRAVSTTDATSDWVAVNHTVSADAQHRPIIKTSSSESGTTGTVDAEVIDPAGTGLIDVEFYSRVGQEGYPSTAEQTDTGLSSGSTASFSVTLDPVRNTYVRIIATLQINGKTAIEEVTLDSDNIAEVEHLSASVDEDTGEVFVSSEAQSDATNQYINVGKGSSPSDPTAGSHDASIAGRDGTVATGVNLDHNQRGFVKAVAENSNGDLGPVRQAVTTRTVAGQPMILIDTSETSDTGSLDAEVHDPDGGTLTVRFYERQGNNSSYGSAVQTQTGLTSGSTVSESIGLIENKNSFIKVEAEVEASGEKNSKEVAFDPNDTPSIHSLSISLNDDGTATVKGGGDADTGSIEYVFSGAFSETTTIDGRTSTYTTNGTASQGETLTVDATPYAGTGGTGSAGTTQSASTTDTTTDQPDVAITASLFFDTNANILTTGAVLNADAVAVHGRITIDGTEPTNPDGTTSDDFSVSDSAGTLDSNDRWKDYDTGVNLGGGFKKARMKLRVETSGGLLGTGTIEEFSGLSFGFNLPDFPGDDQLPTGTKDDTGRRVNDMFDKTGDDATNIDYSDGVTVDDRQPAEAGADVTGNNTSADTSNVNGRAASEVDDASGRALSAIKSSGTSLASGVTGPNDDGEVRDVVRDDDLSGAYSAGTLVVQVN